MATWWNLIITGEPTEADIEHITESIRYGMRSGQLLEDSAETPKE